jgi:hypothetical protein
LVLLGEKFQHKYHTIRKGNRFKVGDKFSPRVWDFEILKGGYYLNEDAVDFELLKTIATNDGLEVNDFELWFKKESFKGQIICWSDDINY